MCMISNLELIMSLDSLQFSQVTKAQDLQFFFAFSYVLYH